MRDDRPGHPWLRTFLEAEGNKTMALNKYRALIARLRELRDAPIPDPAHYGSADHLEHARVCARRDLAIELLAMLGEE